MIRYPNRSDKLADVALSLNLESGRLEAALEPLYGAEVAQEIALDRAESQALATQFEIHEGSKRTRLLYSGERPLEAMEYLQDLLNVARENTAPFRPP